MNHVPFSEFFSPDELNEIDKQYLLYHRKRFEYILKIVNQEFNKNDAFRLLDIGPSFQTEIIRRNFPNAIIDSLGYDHKLNKKRPGDRHYNLDLNKLSLGEGLNINGEYDLIVFAEVLEHLYISPNYVFKALHRILKPSGKMLLQTPNAVSLPNRVLMLIGLNPFMKIRQDLNDPGHFREYTKKELVNYLKINGFNIINVVRDNYFNGSTIIHKVYNLLSNLLPGNLKQGISVLIEIRSRNYKKFP